MIRANRSRDSRCESPVPLRPRSSLFNPRAPELRSGIWLKDQEPWSLKSPKYRIWIGNQPAPYRGLSGPLGPKCRKSLKNVSRPKSLQKVSGTVWDTFRRVSGKFPRGPGDRKNSFSLERMKKPFPHARNFHSRLKFSFSV